MKLGELCLAMVVSVALGAAPPVKITRQQIIRGVITKLSVQETVALQGTRTRLEAAQLVQAIYQERFYYWDRLDTLKRENRAYAIEHLSMEEIMDINHNYIEFKYALKDINRTVESLLAVDKK